MDKRRRKGRWFKGICATLCLLLSTTASSAKGKLVFRPPFHEPRIYESAPKGVHVTTIHAYDPDAPRNLVEYNLLSVVDHSYFALDRHSGNLTTANDIDKKVGETYKITVVADSIGAIEYDHITIVVTEINQFPPKFEHDEYQAEIHINASVGTPVLYVNAHDSDPVSHNAEVYYRMDQNDSSKYFHLNQHTGELSLYMTLNTAPRRLVFSVFAEDGGSPKRWAQTQIKLHVKTISEPLNITVTNITESSAKVCWLHPTFGKIDGYVIKYYGIDTDLKSAPMKNISSTTTITCTVLGSLHPWTGYILYINGWNRYETGQASSEKRFTTRPDYCQRSVCKNGECQKIPEEPGYHCNCNDGYYGEVCDMFDPCSLKPCENYGSCHNTSHNEYNCECVPGFAGENCSDFNPCTIRPSPCKNGATCEMVSSKYYKCHCAGGYYGKTCQDFDPCYLVPCRNDGVCHNVTNEEYQCVCPNGFYGRVCELDVDECSSSPCQNGGTCENGINKFTCQCPSGYHGVFCELKEQCEAETTVTEKGTFYWNATKHGMIVLIICPFGTLYSKGNKTDGYAKRSCLLLKNGTVEWNEMDLDSCQAQGFQEATALAGELQALTKDPEKFSAKDFQQAADQIETILHYAVHDEKLAYDMVSVISNILDVNDSVYEVGDEDGAVTKRLVQAVDTFASNIKLKAGNEINLYTANIAVKAVAYDDTLEEHSQGISFVPLPNAKKKRETKLSENTYIENASQIPSVTLSKEVFDVAKIQLIKEDIRAKFVLYKNDKFFRPKKQVNETCYIIETGKICNELKSFPGRQVIQASINNISIANLTSPVIYTLPMNNKQKYICVYWNEFDRKWSLDGLTTNYSMNQTYCVSSHLTAFSVLLDPTPYLMISKKHKTILSVISYVGCALSIIGLALTIVTYSLFRCLNRDHSGKILLNLCVSLILMNASFLLGSQRGFSQQGIDVCIIVAILIHYFLLTSLAWMCVEAVNMYQLLIHVFASAETHFLLKRFILAWGGPFLIVSITAGIDVKQYYNQNEFCMLSPSNPYIYYISFLGPSCLILLANLIVFVMVTKVLFTPRMTTTTPHTSGNSYMVTTAQVRGAFTVMVLLGVTWIFGAFAVGNAKLVFQYLFCISNSLQGFLIFIVRCLHYHESRNAWLQLFRTGTLKKYRGVMPPGGSLCTNSNSVNKQNGHSRTSRMASISSDTNSVMWNRKDSNTCSTIENGGNRFLKPGNNPSKNTNAERQNSSEINYEKV